jgi:hypothetical protein
VFVCAGQVGDISLLHIVNHLLLVDYGLKKELYEIIKEKIGLLPIEGHNLEFIL